MRHDVEARDVDVCGRGCGDVQPRHTLRVVVRVVWRMVVVLVEVCVLQVVVCVVERVVVVRVERRLRHEVCPEG